jgi:transposase
MANKNRSYTKEFKDSVLKRLDQNETVTSLSDEFNISKSTIYQWVRTHNRKQKNNSINLKSKSNWTSEDKFQVVLESSSFTEAELAEYCRRKGIYVDEVKAWREQCLKANETTTEDPKLLKETLKAEKELNKELQRELRHKEKALAETAALLVLRKKANAIWGDPEED